MCYLKCSIFILLVIRTFFAGEASGSKYIQSRAIEKRKSGCTEKQKVKPRRKKEDKFISLAKQKKRRQKLIEKHRLLKAKFQKMLQRHEKEELQKEIDLLRIQVIVNYYRIITFLFLGGCQ